MRLRKQLQGMLSLKERFWAKRKFIHPREEVSQVVHEIRRFLSSKQTESLRQFLSQFHPADIALAMRFLHDWEKEQVFKLLDNESAAEVLDEADEATERHLVQTTDLERLSDILEVLPPDESADILGMLEPEQRESLLELMEPDEAQEVRGLLQYPPDTAGGIMSSEFVAVKETMTVAQVIELLRERADAESIYYVYVVDDDGALKGVLNLRRLLASSPETLVRDIMTHGVVFVFPEHDQEEVAQMFVRYDLLALPVIDHNYRLIGVITVDDIMDVLQEELIEDHFRAVGSDAAELEKKRPVEIARLRLPWLLITVAIELVAGFVIHRFDKTLGSVILLASFIPVIQAISGNTGLQSATIVVRGLATGHVTLNEWWRPVIKQLQTTSILGCMLGLMLFFIGGFWHGLQKEMLFDPVFGFIVGFSIFVAINLSGFVGTVVPMISKRLGFDPALTAGPFETAIQDVVGVTILLGLATLLLHFMM
ncbi:MAG: magnesium transporter [Armatimonadota bacterium]|nr:magnesium transporter [Armatimonadota bacterium]MCX7777829.1 magnesium transporter [Armatimonadota bacterium]MDW8025820.1 magnesium transporter [Armatimonadota bacterium]